MVFENSSKWLKISAVVLLLAVVFNLISFSTNGWARTQDKNNTERYMDFGLWQACECKCVAPESSGNQFSNNFEPFYRATQAMMTIGFALLIIGCVIVVVSMIIFVLQRTIIIKFVTLGLCIASVVFIFIGITVYGARMTQEINNSPAVSGGLNYSFGLAVVSAILGIAAAILSVLDMRTDPE